MGVEAVVASLLTTVAWLAGRLGQHHRRTGRRTRRAGRAACTAGAAAAPRTSGSGWRSTRTGRIRPGRCGGRCPGTGRIRPGWSRPPIRRRSTGWCRGPAHGGGQLAQPLVVPALAGQAGEQPAQGLAAYRSQRDSDTNPGSACITARVSSSASLSWGMIPIAGRQGARSGNSFSRSSVRT